MRRIYFRTYLFYWAAAMILSILAILAIGSISLLARLGFTFIAKGYAERRWPEEGDIQSREKFPKIRHSRDDSDKDALTQKILQPSETSYRAFFEVSADAFTILDGERYIDCNQATLELFGYESKEAFCRITPVMVSPEFQPDGELSVNKANRMITETLKTGSHRFEWWHQRKDNTIFPTEVMLNKFRIGNRTVIQAVIRDITQRKREEADLQRSREELEKILNSIPVGIAIIGKDKRIRKVNRAAQKMIGYQSEKEIVGHICHKAFCPAKQGRCPVLDLGNTVDESEKTLVTKSGREMPILKTVIPITLDGKEYLLESFVDITAQKQTEEKIKNSAIALEASNKTLEEYIAIADSATRVKGEFLANMSHEIRTPMTAILGFADLLRERFDGRQEPVPECKGCSCHESNLEYINTIFANGQHLLRIINDILDLSKIEAEKIDIERTACSPRELMDDIKSLMEVRAKAKDLPIRVECVGDLPETVFCDSTRIRQILINLLANAIKFTEKGEVRLVGQLVEQEGKAPFLRFDVIDTGIGMSKEQIGKIFRPFEQADSSTSRKFGGTGLGLTISKRLAGLLGGDLVLTQSSPGEGSTFTLTTVAEIPDPLEMIEDAIRWEISEESKDTLLPEITKLDCRVLLAEDGRDNQRLISLLLKQAGAKVTVAENGMMAFEKAVQAEQAGNPYDVILMDMQMPVMDGYEATRKLRLLAYSRPIIALTAHAMAGDSSRCKIAGCDDYLAKPIERHSFLAMVAKYASRELQGV